MSASPHRQAFQELLRDPQKHLVGILEGSSLARRTLKLKAVLLSRPSLSESALIEHCLGSWVGWARVHVEGRDEPITLPLPWMTDRGTFFLDGAEHTPIVQLLPRPGLALRSAVTRSGLERLISADIIPQRGRWVRLRARLPEEDSSADFRISCTPRRKSLANLLETRSILLGEEGRRRLNAGIANVLPGVPLVPETEIALTPYDIELASGAIHSVAREPQSDRILRALAEDSLTSLENLRALTVADQLRAAVADSLIDTQIELLRHEGKGEGSTALWADALSVLERRIAGRINALFRDRRILQRLDETNPLAELSHLRKVTRRGPGGIKTEHAPPEQRDLDESHAERLCPYETPESELIGLNIHLTRGAFVKGEMIVPASDSDQPNILGWAASLIPFLPHNDAPRAVAGAKNMKQALPLVEPERPLVATGTELEAAEELGCVIRARAEGVVKKIDSGCITLEVEGREGDREEVRYFFSPRHPGSTGTPTGLSPRVTTGDQVTEGQVLAAHPATDREGALALGTNLLVAYLSYRGLNFEDGIVASARLVDDDVLTSLHLKRVRIELADDEALVAGRTDTDGTIRPESLDEMGVVKPGTLVEEGDELLRSFKRETLWRSDVPEGTVVVHHDGHRYEGRRIQHIAEPGQSGVVERVVKHSGPDGTARVLDFWLASKRRLQVGDKLMGRHGNKGVVTRILPTKEMPFVPSLGRHVDLVLNPVGPVNRKNLGQLIETHVALVAKHQPELVKPAQPFAALRTIDRGELGDWLKSTNVVDGNGKTTVELPRTGLSNTRRATERPVVVGYQYFFKLNHLAADKISFRSVGPGDRRGYGRGYGHVSGQPVGGRRHRGGQRLGEMEAWVLKAWNTPFLLEELLNAKSDDLAAREQLRAFARRGLDHEGAQLSSPHIPESIRVLSCLLGSAGFGLRAFRKSRLSEKSSEAKTEHVHEEVSLRDPALLARDICHMAFSPLGDDQVLSLAGRASDEATSGVGALLAATGKTAGPSLVRLPVAFTQRRIVKLACGHEGFFDEIVDASRPEAAKREAAKRRGGGTDGEKVGEPEACKPCMLGGKSRENAKRAIRSERESWSPAPGGLYDPEIWGSDEEGEAWHHRIAAIELPTKWDRDTGRIPSPEREPAPLVIHPLTGRPIRYLPVLPPALRRSPEIERGRLPGGSLDRFYARVLSAVAELDELRELVGAASEMSEPRTPTNRDVDAATSAQETQRKLAEAEDTVQKCVGELIEDGLLPLIGGRTGFLRRYIVGKRVDFSGRAVIVGDPELDIDECGLPLKAAIELLRDPLEARLLEAIGAGVPTTDVVMSILHNEVPRLRDTAGLLRVLERECRVATPRLARSLGVPQDDLLDELQRILVRPQRLMRRGESAGRRRREELVPDAPSERLARAVRRAQPALETIARQVLRDASLTAGEERIDPWLEAASVHPGSMRRKLGELVGAVFNEQSTIRELVRATCKRLFSDCETVVLLNRAPSLHRYNIQAFIPVIHPEDVISINPLVCAAFNADFDGDTMAVHVPVRRIAIREARQSMMPSGNRRSVAGGQSLVHIAREMLGGLAALAAKDATTFERRFGTKVETDSKSGMLMIVGSDDRASFADWLRRRSAEEAGATWAVDAMRAGFECAASAGLSVSFLDLPKGGGEGGLKMWLDLVDAESALAVLARSGALRDLEGLRSQLSGQYGSFQTLSGRPTPRIATNLVGGFATNEILWACRGARKSLADVKLVTPVSGDFTRRMAWAAEPIWVGEADCQTSDGIDLVDLTLLDEEGEVRSLLGAREWASGRISIRTPSANSTTRIRSPLTCRSVVPGSVCAACYGLDLSTGSEVRVGTRVGFIAAQSIGERGTQLAMRTFHGGGVSGFDITTGLPRVIAVAEGWKVAVPERDLEDAWSAVAAGRPGFQDGARMVPRVLGDLAGSGRYARLISLLRVFLYEMYLNYKPAEVNPKHFEVLLLAQLLAGEVAARRVSGPDAPRPSRGEVWLGLTRSAPVELTPLASMAFRGARQRLEECGKSAHGIEFDTHRPPLDRMLGVRL